MRGTGSVLTISLLLPLIILFFGISFTVVTDGNYCIARKILYCVVPNLDVSKHTFGASSEHPLPCTPLGVDFCVPNVT